MEPPCVSMRVCSGIKHNPHATHGGSVGGSSQTAKDAAAVEYLKKLAPDAASEAGVSLARPLLVPDFNQLS